MARIAGVDLPRDKRVEIALTYIYGIGVRRQPEILSDDRDRPEHAGQGSGRGAGGAAARGHRPQLPGRRRPAPRSQHEHQAPAGDRLLPRPAPSPQPAGARPADADQCPHQARRHAGRCLARSALASKFGADVGSCRGRQVQFSVSGRNADAETQPATAATGAQARQAPARRAGPRREKRMVPQGQVHIQATFNNTIVTITDLQGNTLPGPAPVSAASRARARARPTPRSWPPAQAAKHGHGHRACARSMCSSRGLALAASRRSARCRRLGCACAPSRTSRRCRTTAAARPRSGVSRSGGWSCIEAAHRLYSTAQSLQSERDEGRQAVNRLSCAIAKLYQEDTLARYTDSVCKLCRREGMKLYLEGRALLFAQVRL